MDLIDRQAAYDAIMREGRNVDSRYLESERIIHECDAVEAIAMLPTIDAVLVVRCKDCKWWKSSWKYCHYIHFDTDKKFYCAVGERRPDATFK